MPVFEYKCDDCGYKFEEFQTVKDDPITICPKCQGKVKKLISLSYSHVDYANPSEYYETVIKPDVRRIVDKINAGDADAAADILGEENIG